MKVSSFVGSVSPQQRALFSPPTLRVNFFVCCCVLCQKWNKVKVRMTTWKMNRELKFETFTVSWTFRVVSLTQREHSVRWAFIKRKFPHCQLFWQPPERLQHPTICRVVFRGQKSIIFNRQLKHRGPTSLIIFFRVCTAARDGMTHNRKSVKNFLYTLSRRDFFDILGATTYRDDPKIK